MQGLKREVSIAFEEDEGEQRGRPTGQDPIPLSISIKREDLLAVIDDMAAGQFTVEEYLDEKAKFGPKIRVVD